MPASICSTEHQSRVFPSLPVELGICLQNLMNIRRSDAVAGDVLFTLIGLRNLMPHQFTRPDLYLPCVYISYTHSQWGKYRL